MNRGRIECRFNDDSPIARTGIVVSNIPPQVPTGEARVVIMCCEGRKFYVRKVSEVWDVHGIPG
jgi:hypothetical protein